MQSTIVMALRSVVMLVALLTVPLAAIYGTGSWPRVQAAIDQWRHKLAAELDPSRKDAAPATMDAALGPISPLIAATPEPPVATAPAPAEPMPAATVPTPPPVVATPPSPFWPAEAPLAPAAPPPSAVTNVLAPPKVDPQIQPAAFLAGSPKPEPVEPPMDTPDRMGWIQHRLQTLGAAYYRLETAGVAGEMFRFHCKMTSLSNPNYVRYFEATSGEPLRAMQHVLDQVDAWIAKSDARR